MEGHSLTGCVCMSLKDWFWFGCMGVVCAAFDMPNIKSNAPHIGEEGVEWEDNMRRWLTAAGAIHNAEARDDVDDNN